jgi:hypothetical protein
MFSPASGLPAGPTSFKFFELSEPPMKVLVLSLLSLFIVSSAFSTPDEYRPDRTSRQKYRRHSARWKQARRKARRTAELRRRAAARRKLAQRRTVRQRPRQALARTARPRVKAPLPGTRGVQPQASALPPSATGGKAKITQPSPAPTSGKPAVRVIPPKQATALPPKGWRGQVKRSIALTSDGRNVPVENYASLTNLMKTLPDDGEVRVRYGIYNGSRTYGPVERMDVERRSVRVPCWIYAVRFDSTGDESERDIQLLVGTTNDSSRARYMIVEIPGPNGINDELFDPPRRQLSALLQGYEMTSSFRRVQPRQAVVEGSLFFDGARSLERVNDPSGDLPIPSTVWEIHPVTSIMGATTN